MIATMAALTGVESQARPGARQRERAGRAHREPEDAIREHLVLRRAKRSNLAVRKGKWMYIGAKGQRRIHGQQAGSDMPSAGPAAITYAGYENSDIENGRIKPDCAARAALRP